MPILLAVIEIFTVFRLGLTFIAMFRVTTFAIGMNIACITVLSIYTNDSEWPKQREGLFAFHAPIGNSLRMTSTSPQMFKKCLELRLFTELKVV